MRRPHSGEEARISKTRFTTEGADVDAAGGWQEGHASYPGTSATLSLGTLGSRGLLPAAGGAADRSRGHRSRPNGEGLNMERWTVTGLSMAAGVAKHEAEMVRTRYEGRDHGCVRGRQRHSYWILSGAS